MRRLAHDNLISGFALVLLGVAITVYATTKYSVGTLDRMGPGMYPAALGALLAICGGAITIGAAFRPSEGIRIDYRALGLVVLGILFFAFLIDSVGLVPATLALVLSSNLATGRIRPVQSLTLAVLVSAAVLLVFRYGLRIPIEIFVWPL